MKPPRPISEHERIKNTIAHLRLCQRARNAGYPVSYTTSPIWLVHMAINRRAGWPDDPSHSRGSAMPVNGRYPRRAQGSEFMELWRLADRLNHRIVVREREVPSKIRARISAGRLWGVCDE